MVLGPEDHLFITLHNLYRAADPRRPTIENMGIDHGRSHISVTQEFLDLEVVHAALQWSGGKRVAPLQVVGEQP